ncbi:MAG: hypothetical protein ABIQ73_21925 [Acidimicrobiales bacterium]
MPAALFPPTSNPVLHEGPFARKLDDFMRSLEGQQVVSTSRCIDGLLDLYNVTLDPTARRLIEATLGDVRFTNAVRGEHLVRALNEISDATLVDHSLS